MCLKFCSREEWCQDAKFLLLITTSSLNYLLNSLKVPAGVCKGKFIEQENYASGKRLPVVVGGSECINLFKSAVSGYIGPMKPNSRHRNAHGPFLRSAFYSTSIRNIIPQYISIKRS